METYFYCYLLEAKVVNMKDKRKLTAFKQLTLTYLKAKVRLCDFK